MLDKIVCTKIKSDNNESVTKEEEKDWPQIVSVIIACLPAVTAGILFSWSSPSIPYLVNDRVNYNISLDEASLFTIISSASMVIFALPFSTLSDKIGRKWALYLIAVPHLVVWIINATATSVYLFYVARILNGMTDACMYASLPMYIGEICTPKVRGRAGGNLMSFAGYFGQFLINVIGSYLDVSKTSYICLILPVCFTILMPFVPESPYYLIMKERYDDAKKSLRKLRWKSNVEEEFNKLKKDVERQISETATWKDVFTIKSNRKAVVCALFLRVAMLFSGMCVFIQHNQFVFQKSGSSLGARESSIIFMFLCCFLNLFAGLIVDHLGRKMVMVYSLLLCGISLAALTVFFYIDQWQKDIDTSSLKWFPITGMVVFITVFSFGTGVLPTLMLGELFSASIKGKGLCLYNVTFGLMIFVTNYIFYFLNSLSGIVGPFLFFSATCFVSAAICARIIPETSGKTLEQIQQMLKENKPKTAK